MTVLAFVLASGGYGGYKVVENYNEYGAGFDKQPHLVTEVVDGDTFIVGEAVRVRLLGVDAPEKGECFGKEAKEKLSELILGREVVLEKDQTAKDGFDRLLRYVFVYEENPEADNLFVNKTMAREGFAESQYVKPSKRYLSQIQAAEREAEEEKKGMWDKCDMKSSTATPEREEASESFSEECVIKGNISKNYTKDYFLPGCPNYKRVKVDPRKGEQWFCAEEEAEEAGWQKSASCDNI